MRARVRVAEPRDAAAVAAIYAPIVRDTAISFELEPPDADEMRRRIEHTLEVLPWLIAEREDGVIGYAYAASHRARAAYRWSVDVSVSFPAQSDRSFSRKSSRRLGGAQWMRGTPPFVPVPPRC
jgi:phosphinothricin acetyltransferase